MIMQARKKFEYLKSPIQIDQFIFMQPKLNQGIYFKHFQIKNIKSHLFPNISF